jgi:hypothetical protein
MEYGFLFGAAYPVVVGATLATCVHIDPTFRPPFASWISLLAPAVAYYALEYFVNSHQMFAAAKVGLVLTIVGVAIVIAPCVSHRTNIIPAGAAVELALVLWRFVPDEGPGLPFL